MCRRSQHAVVCALVQNTPVHRCNGHGATTDQPARECLGGGERGAVGTRALGAGYAGCCFFRGSPGSSSEGISSPVLLKKSAVNWPCVPVESRSDSSAWKRVGVPGASGWYRARSRMGSMTILPSLVRCAYIRDAYYVRDTHATGI